MTQKELVARLPLEKIEMLHDELEKKVAEKARISMNDLHQLECFELLKEMVIPEIEKDNARQNGIVVGPVVPKLRTELNAPSDRLTIWCKELLQKLRDEISYRKKPYELESAD